VAYRLEQEYGVMTRCGLHCAPRAHKTLNTFPYGTVRFAFSHFNTLDEVDICIEGIKAILR
ncbi:MAG: aminotransferase class V-fold PLP-dependent enzyme, partial [Oscillospiraceae bacterium]